MHTALIPGCLQRQVRRAGDKTNEEITNELIKENQDVISDLEEAAGLVCPCRYSEIRRLLPHVKEKALEFLDRTSI